MKRKYNKLPVEDFHKSQIEYMGALLRSFRNDTFMSRKEFADKHNFSRILIERIETGKNVNTLSVLRYISHLGLLVSDVFTDFYE